MLCHKPYMVGNLIPVGCGGCMSCRISRHRLWTHRILLESYKHEFNCFVTLTYRPEKLPMGGTLVPSHPRNWIKRLRKSLWPRRLRYYLVGEYGEISQRPHYHAALFGCGLSDTQTIEDTWGDGYAYVGTLTKDSAQYIARYVTKRLNGKDERSLDILKGRYPEYARMSLKPGIGAEAMKDLGDLLTTDQGIDLMETHGQDVPTCVQQGKRKLPLGRYLRKKLREKVGDEDEMRQLSKEECTKEMLQVREEARKAEPINERKDFRQILLDEHKQDRLKSYKKFKIYNSRSKL